MTKSKKTSDESKTLRKYFQYYDDHGCRHLTFENFIKSLNRMGIPNNGTNKIEKDYFKNMTNGNKYINYHKYTDNIEPSVYPKYNQENNISFSKQWENTQKNTYFHRPNTAPMKF